MFLKMIIAYQYKNLLKFTYFIYEFSYNKMTILHIDKECFSKKYFKQKTITDVKDKTQNKVQRKL